MRDNKKIEELVAIRKEKLNKLNEVGIDPYPHNYNIDTSIEDLFKQENQLISSEKIVSIAGRVVSIRDMGKALFLNIQGDIKRIQCYVSNKNMEIQEDDYKVLIQNIDIGDIVGVDGEMFYTKTNEFTLRSRNFTLLSK